MKDNSLTLMREFEIFHLVLAQWFVDKDDLFFSDKKKGLSFLGGIILKTWHWSPHSVRLSCLTRNVVELFILFLFFLHFL